MTSNDNFTTITFQVGPRRSGRRSGTRRAPGRRHARRPGAAVRHGGVILAAAATLFHQIRPLIRTHGRPAPAAAFVRTDALPHRGEDATRQPLPRQPTLI
ncbi:hypothetical protein QZM46_19570 [Burkholderia vietnamiensis]|uniref:hypothetical protein n=1 Tax=Burkholderia TaxID=32008 RepID=UPI0012D91C76|nr:MULTISPECIES: hypothetical protein [Burkholderia]MBR8083877.1 hypothetical protein [Burkholderia vietnamiensis]MBR8188912.1 hypothetical protein [Burkholderia vietnamiensis]MDN7553525.1 hypothetical protein [Burkholderia vietnamiensis]MEC4596982.1 hypothetical protein [Burkholderia vietnamiensis]QMI48692.1 hypothetical protein MBR110_24635 [Burkholderia sp. MBR-1]